MLNMIKADFYRIVRSKAIYIAAVMMLAMITVSVYFVEPGSIGVGVDFSVDNGMGSGINDEMAEMDYEQLNALSTKEFRELMLKTTDYSLDRDILAHNMNMYYVFIFIAAVAVAADFSGSCVKNTLSSAISRKKYFLSKLVFVILVCAVMLFLNTYLMYFGNLLFNGSNLASGIWCVTRITLMQLPPMLALASILTGFAFIFKRMASFNAVVIPFVAVAQLVLNFLAFLLKLPEKTMQYELQTMLAMLAGKPSASYILQSYAVCAVIILVFTAAGWFSFCKAEIK